jgi:hypothetical protein
MRDLASSRALQELEIGSVRNVLQTSVAMLFSILGTARAWARLVDSSCIQSEGRLLVSIVGLKLARDHLHMKKKI